MGQEPRPSRAPMTDARDPDTLREGIEQTRQGLGETVEALAAKTDVRAHAKRKLGKARSSLAKPAILGAGGAAVGVLIWQVRKRREDARPKGAIHAGRAYVAALGRAVAALAR